MKGSVRKIVRRMLDQQDAVREYLENIFSEKKIFFSRAQFVNSMFFVKYNVISYTLFYVCKEGVSKTITRLLEVISGDDYVSASLYF